MTDTLSAVLPIHLREHLDGRLPGWLTVHWFSSKEQAFALAPGADIGWFDMYNKADMATVIRSATRLRWLNSIFAGVDAMPLPELAERGVLLTNGAGINAITIAEYVVMGMLALAKGLPAVLQAQQEQQWLKDAPGKRELFDSRALILGSGGIGQLVRDRLRAFGVEVTMVRRRADASAGELGAQDWRGRLGEFDWIILAVPSTAETRHMIGVAELEAMKPDAVLVNVARGNVVDQDALVNALRQGRLGGAFLDVTDPEPLPVGHPLWTMDKVLITMHLSGRSQTRMFERAAARFVDNLTRFRAGQPLANQVDLALGY